MLGYGPPERLDDSAGAGQGGPDDRCTDQPLTAGAGDSGQHDLGCPPMSNFPLADEFFLINHNDLTGRPLIRRDLLGLGLVVALLAELIVEGRVGIREGRVIVLDKASHGDDASDFIITGLAAQWSNYPVRTWTDNLDDTAYELVARRLVERGTVQRGRTRRLFGPRKDVFLPAKREAVQPLLLLDSAIKNPEEADVQRALLITMVAATGAEHVLASLPDRDRVRTAVTELSASLSAELTELVAGFEEAITARLLSIRR